MGPLFPPHASSDIKDPSRAQPAWYRVRFFLFLDSKSMAATALAAQPCGFDRRIHNRHAAAYGARHAKAMTATCCLAVQARSGACSGFGRGFAKCVGGGRRPLAGDNGGRWSAGRWTPPPVSEDDEAETPIDLDTEDAVPGVEMPEGA